MPTDKNVLVYARSDDRVAVVASWNSKDSGVKALKGLNQCMWDMYVNNGYFGQPIISFVFSKFHPSLCGS